MSHLFHVKSSDGQTFAVEEKIARHSSVFKEMLDNLGESVSQEKPFECVSEGEIVAKALEWLKQHQDDKCIPDEDDYDWKEKNLDKWDEEFFKGLGSENHCELLILSNFLDMANLRAHCAKALARSIADKSTEEMRQFVLSASEIAEEERREAEQMEAKEKSDAKKEAKKEDDGPASSKPEEEDVEDENSDEEDAEKEVPSESSDDD